MPDQNQRDAPVETREHFGLACNLCLYGWYHYRFGMPAKLYGYLALETAVRRKYEQFERRPSRNRSFSDLLKWASGAGLLKDGGFSHLFARDELTHKVRPLGRRYLDPDGTHYVEEVFASTFLRNALAHGSTLLLSPGDIACSLQIIADGINQLFPLEI